MPRLAPRFIRNLSMPVKVVGGVGLGYIAYHGLMGTSYNLPGIGMVSPSKTVGAVTGIGAAMLLGSALADTGTLGRSGADMLGSDAMSRNPDGDEPESLEEAFGETIGVVPSGDVDPADFQIDMGPMRGEAGYVEDVQPPYVAPWNRPEPTPYFRNERDVGMNLDSIARQYDDGSDPVLWGMVNRARCSVTAGKPSAVAQIHAIESALSDRTDDPRARDTLVELALSRAVLEKRWGMSR